MSGHGGAGDQPRTAEPPARATAGSSAAGGAAVVTLVAVLGGVGVLPGGGADARPVSQGSASVEAAPAAAVARPPGPRRPPGPCPRRRRSASRPRRAPRTSHRPRTSPAGSGTGRRVVFDMADQRVWLVDRRAGEDAVRRTLPGLGERHRQPRPRHATRSTPSRCTRSASTTPGRCGTWSGSPTGQNAAIGFHDIPVLDGRLVQTRDDLGTPQSHGCIRQWRPDATALWAFAPVGTKVVVVA